MKITIGADDFSLFKQVQSDVEPLILALSRDHRLDEMHLHVKYGILICTGYHKEEPEGKTTAIGSTALQKNDPRKLARVLVDRLLKAMGRTVIPEARNGRQIIGHMWLPN